MTLRHHLQQFYRTYDIPDEGGVHDKTFVVPLPWIKLVLPNFAWRKRMLYVHDMEHILNEQDTTWAGEIFIASWEIATGYYKNFPIIIFPLWTMGWALWYQPSALFNGFRKGYRDRGIARLKLSQAELMDMELSKLQSLTLNQRATRSTAGLYFNLTLWVLLSQVVFLFLLIVLMASFVAWDIAWG